MHEEKKKIYSSLVFPFIFVVLLWVIKLGEVLTHTDFGFLGVYPLKLSGLVGIITSPLIHGDFKHLFANSVPLFILGSCLFYFYKDIAIRTFLLIYFITGLSVWVGGREAYHIGASGVVYGLASFLFFSGIFRKDIRLLAITLFVAFLYGSMIWGIFPDFYPEKNISYESHFWGLVVGAVLAFYYRKLGPQKKKYDWELEEELENAFYESEKDTDDNQLEITYSRPKNEKPD
jgi:membrane associated rhomboid family serine protease